MNQECWLEMDLYWFQRGAVEERAARLFDRLMPLWQREPGARKGLALCVGWLFDSLLFWNGDPQAPIPCCQAPKYEVWTYQRFANLIQALKAEARSRGVEHFNVALILLAVQSQAYSENIFEGCSGRTEETHERSRYDIVGHWFPEHQEVVDSRHWLFSFNAKVVVPGNEAVCLREAPDFGEYLADKLCGMARFTGLDAILFRDGSFSPPYQRGAAQRFAGPELTEEWTQSIIRTLSAIKAQLPGLIIIGYDSGASVMEEWRSHGFDLERVARAGCLDIWITQTWASAWQDYWPCHALGYTFQLSRLLTNLAMLADTPCKHLFLVETFDAWEPWDSIHQYPSKVAWEMWAYSHAAVLRPGGEVSRCAGVYSSWMNKDAELLPEQTVEDLRRVLTACASDLERDPVPGGPCLVYNREGLEHLLNHPAEYDRGEAFDDWTAMLQKYGLPVLSVTREEWLPEVEADALLVPVGAILPESRCAHLCQRIEAGTPVLFMGQADLLPESLRQALGLKVLAQPRLAQHPSAARVMPPLSEELSMEGLVINQRARSLDAAPGWTTLIECLGGPVFAAHKKLPVWLWETPEWGTPMDMHMTNLSIQSPQTYDAVARTFGEQGWGAEGLGWFNRDWQKPVCFLFWRYRQDDEIYILLGNLETGVTGNSQFCVTGDLTGVAVGDIVSPFDSKVPGKLTSKDEQTQVTLAAHGSALLMAR